MLNFNSPIQNEKKYNEIKITEVEPTIKINLRSNKREFSTKIGKILSILPPTEANTSSGNENYSLLWLSPDEWLIYSKNKNQNFKDQIELEKKLFNEISKINQGAVTNVSDHWVLFNLKGNKIYDLLTKSCPFDFNEFKKKKGSVSQTIVNHIDVIIHNNENNDLNLFVRRSFSEDLWLWINDSASFLLSLIHI